MEPLDMLNDLIADGYEYPDAEYRVVCEFGLSVWQIEELVEAYDAQ